MFLSSKKVVSHLLVILYNSLEQLADFCHLRVSVRVRYPRMRVA